MPKQLVFILIVSCLVVHCTPGNADLQSQQSDQSVEQTESFETASVRFEQNATDGDVEVVFEVKGGDAGLLSLKIIAPDGRTVVDFTAPDPTTLGIRQFQMESPEPGDTESLKKAYPEGKYTFTGTDAEGVRFQAAATLNHQLPPTADFIHPKAEAQEVQIEGLIIRWNLLEGVVSYIIEIEQDELEVNVTTILSEEATSFAVPENFLQPDMEYALSIGTVTTDGNISFVETSFTTTKNE